MGSNTLFPFKLTHLYVIKQLANDPEFGKIFELTRLMLNGETKNYQHEIVKSALWLQKLGIYIPKSLYKTRIMNVQSLCSLTLYGKVSYNIIADALCVSTNNVEYW